MKAESGPDLDDDVIAAVVSELQSSYSIGNFANTVGSDWEFAPKEEIAGIIKDALKKLRETDPREGDEHS